MTANKQPKAKPLTKLQAAEREASILSSAIYQQYSDIDELLSIMWMISNEAEKPEPNLYQLRNAINGARTMLIANQSMMMDCSGLEY